MKSTTYSRTPTDSYLGKAMQLVVVNCLGSTVPVSIAQVVELLLRKQRSQV